jgi:hypothetical protein
MAANKEPIFVRIANMSAATFTSADTTTKKTLFTAASDGSLLRSLSLTSSDSATINLDLFLSFSGTDYSIGTIQITTGLGVTAATAAVNALDTSKLAINLRPDGSLFMPTGWTLKGNCKATMTTGTLTVVAAGGDY